MTINIILWWSISSCDDQDHLEPKVLLASFRKMPGASGCRVGRKRPTHALNNLSGDDKSTLSSSSMTRTEHCVCVFIVIILSSSYSSHESSSSDLSHQILKSFNLSPHPLIWGQFPPHLVASQSFREILDASNCNGGQRSKQFVWGPSTPCHLLHLVTFTLSPSPF